MARIADPYDLVLKADSDERGERDTGQRRADEEQLCGRPRIPFSRAKALIRLGSSSFRRLAHIENKRHVLAQHATTLPTRGRIC